MAAPVLMKPIPAQIVNERAAFGPFDLKEFIQVAEGGAKARFSAILKSGASLPTGMICTEDGIVTGIPGKDTQGNYEIIVSAENEAGDAQAEFVLTIKPSLVSSATEYMDQLKAQVWSALQQNLPLPNIEDMYNQPISELDVYYLLERWASITIWDAFNLELPSEKKLLTLEGISPHYLVYDRGSCLVATPKDLFSHERTIDDGLRTARVLAGEAFRRDWTVQLVGFEKLTRAAWVEFQRLGDVHDKRLEVVGYSPSVDDVKLYSDQYVNSRFELEYRFRNILLRFLIYTYRIDNEY
jgi:hypothetical protein